MRPVVLTVSPSVMCSYSPEHHRADRVALQVEREAEGVASETRASRPASRRTGRGCGRCRRSPRPRCPGCASRAPASRFWIRLLMSSLISEGLSCMTCSLCVLRLALERGLERAELRARRAVDDLVADHDARRRRSAPVDVDAALSPCGRSCFSSAATRSAHLRRRSSSNAE